jgi:2-keto-3-deoxy-L-fuconate dehydrogenase
VPTTPDPIRLDGLTALVTGGTSGIGLATAHLLSARGARVVVLDRVPPPLAQSWHCIQADVADDDDVRIAVRDAVEHLGGLDIVVNNAGIGGQGTVADNLSQEWRDVFEVNVLGVVRVSREALPYLRTSNCASIVNLCSIVATAGVPDRALYSASKGAVLSLTLAMAADYAEAGIRVNCVNPGTVDTPWVQRLLASASDPVAELRALKSRQPIGRLVTAEEVAEAIAYLASPGAGAVTGITLAVDGGMQGLRMRAPEPPGPVRSP